MQTEYSFLLPRGYLDQEGTLHKEGTMRLASAADEILPLKDPRVRQNPGYLNVIILSRVVTRLGSLPAVDTGVIERLYTADIAYLKDLYDRINAVEPPVYRTVCPHCHKEIEVSVNFMDPGL